jgi:amidase
MSDHEFAYRSAAELAALLAHREISAVELLDASLRRIEARDGELNAVVVRDFDRARQAAEAADAALARGARGPLLGVPMTVKESFNVAGLPTTWGRPDARAFVAAEDALAVSRLKAAGAVILGKTNVPLNLGDWQAYNDIYGTTNNPWNLARTPGGSSGGAAAALAAGFVPLEIGSDIGGSLRVPAHFCGVASHKPSHGLLPPRGHAPPFAPAMPGDVDLAVIGPMARTAGDLSLALDLLAGPDGPLATAYRLELPRPRHTALRDFRVLVLTEHPLGPTAAPVRAAIERLAEQLEREGAHVARSSEALPDLVLVARTFIALLTSFFGADLPEPAYRRIAAAVADMPAEADGPAAWAPRGFVLSHRDWIHADRIRSGVQARWRALFRDFDVVLAPPAALPAFPHDHSRDFDARQADLGDGVIVPYGSLSYWQGVATLPGLPATIMPLERTPEGLPTGVQIIGPFLEDRTPLAFASLIEAAFGGFVRPPGW